MSLLFSRRTLGLVSLPLLTLVFTGCTPKTASPTGNATAATGPADNRVVLYCSVDQVFSKPIIDELEKETGLDIQPLFDVESAKAAGLANKLRGERKRPRADVFWASTILQSQLLAKEGILQAYASPSAKDVPDGFKDPKGYWTAMGLRARVLISSKPSKETNLAFVPKDLKGRFAIANPAFGTSSDWIAAYGNRWGIEKAADFVRGLKEAGVRILPGNADVASAVADGNLEYGVTDTDDYLSQKREGKTVYLVKTTQENVLVPGSASKVADAPHSENAEKLLDAILSKETEAKLIKAMPGVFSVRRLDDPNNWKSGGEDFGFLAQTKREDFGRWRASWEALRKPLEEILAP